MSAANFVELAMVLERQVAAEALHDSETFFSRAEIAIEPVTVEPAYIARQAFLDYGKGRHRAGLKFGDCFAHPFVRATGEPLLCKGSDFAQSDVLPAT